MANIKSSIKRISVTKNKQAQNRPIKSNLANEIKKFQNAVHAGELAHAAEQLNVVFSKLDAAAGDRVIHPNKANRQKSKLAAMLYKAQQKSGKKPAAKPAATTAEKPATVKPAAPKTAAAKTTAAKPATKKTTTTKSAK